MTAIGLGPLARLEVPDGRDFPDLTIRWDDRRQELVIYTDRLPGELHLVLVDGRGIDHHMQGFNTDPALRAEG